MPGSSTRTWRSCRPERRRSSSWSRSDVPARLLAGRLAPRALLGTPDARHLHAAPRRGGPPAGRDREGGRGGAGPARSGEVEPFALAWTPPSEPPARERTLCLIDG